MRPRGYRTQVQRFSIRHQGGELEILRADLRLWAKEREQGVSTLYGAIDTIVGDGLAGLDDRFKDIAEPLLAISILSDCESSNGSGDVVARLCALLLEMAGAKVQADDSTLAGLVRALGGGWIRDRIDEQTKH